ncbi:condensin subunit ScpA [Streptomyces sp. SLBN-118]|uniref:segregation and condensation protein A n=1 Tax=Streptomyces sp. SLBN-118 TaxID=2768454 RepID=UPI00116E0625|nr:segregation/condensation protein A [Streptomyces sp. SLBN-118]TQK43615.1 condensin subunit ScpA [Streptomyces sp. SLBN-118]
MPTTDDSAPPPPRRSLGRGPGTGRGGRPAVGEEGFSPTPPHPETGGEPPAPRRPLRGDTDTDTAVPEPAAGEPAEVRSPGEAPAGPGRPLRGEEPADAGRPAEPEPDVAGAESSRSGGAGVPAGAGLGLRGNGGLAEADVAGPEALVESRRWAEASIGSGLGLRGNGGLAEAAPDGRDAADARPSGRSEDVGAATAELSRPLRGDGEPADAGPPAEAELAAGDPGAAGGDNAPQAGDGEGPGDAAAGAPAAPAAPVDDGRFTVRLANFEGPFDLLLQLISKHKMDVTEVALSKVTDEFMAHIRAMGNDWDLDQTTEFLVVAATLLDLKAARLLPAAEVEDEADLALLEARDLLFARLLQYRAYKQIAEIFSGRLEDESRRYPRTVGLEPHHAELLPEVVISIGADGFAGLAVKAMQPRPKPQVYVDHIHAPLVSVREQAEVVVARLREAGQVSFRDLAADAPDTLTVVARFLALLELYREKAVVLEQETALGELMVRWTGGEGADQPIVTDEFDSEVRENQEEDENA